MGQLDLKAKRIMIRLHNKGMNGVQIEKELRVEHNISVTSQAVNRFLRYYKIKKCIARKQGSGRPSKITETVLQLIEDAMNNDDETTATQLQSILRCNGNNISLASIRRCRAVLGWTYHGSRYCQMIRAPNKDKRMQFAQDCVQRGDDFDDVI